MLSKFFLFKVRYDGCSNYQWNEQQFIFTLTVTPIPSNAINSLIQSLLFLFILVIFNTLLIIILCAILILVTISLHTTHDSHIIASPLAYKFKKCKKKKKFLLILAVSWWREASCEATSSAFFSILTVKFLIWLSFVLMTVCSSRILVRRVSFIDSILSLLAAASTFLL